MICDWFFDAAMDALFPDFNSFDADMSEKMEAWWKVFDKDAKAPIELFCLFYSALMHEVCFLFTSLLWGEVFCEVGG